MGLLDSLLGGGGGGAGDLGDRVIAMRQQGMDDGSIIQSLQQQGVQMPNIQNALMQADIKMRVAGAPMPPQGGAPMMPPQAEMPQEMQGQMGPGPMDMPPEQMGPMGPDMGQMGPMGPGPQFGPSPMGGPEMMPGGPEMGMGPGPMSPPPGYEPQSAGPDVNAINDRIDDLVARVNMMEKGNLDLKNEVVDVKEVIADLKGKYVHIQEEASVKLEEYSKDLESVGAHIKALERVLQRVFSATAQNMRELSEIVKSMKGKLGPADQEPPKKRSPLVS